jgi:transposase
LNFIIHFTTSTRRLLDQKWQWAVAQKSPQPQLLKRLTALQLLDDQHPPAAIAQRLGVAVSTVYAWLKAFLVKGEAALIYGPKQGRPCKLNSEQLDRLKALILAGPSEGGYASGLWNAALVAQLIEREFNQHFNPRYVPTLLARLGFSYQKARFESDHLDPVRRNAWLEVEWPTIVEKAKAEGALLLFGDEASFAQWGSLSYTWALKGHQPVVATTGIRRAYKVFGMLDYFTGQLFYQGHTDKFKAETYCEFLTQVLEHTGPDQKVIIIQDGARYHTAKVTKEFVAAHADRLEVHQLPAYSPDFNPIEHLWRRVKRQATHNRYFATFEALIAGVEAALQALAATPSEVKILAGTVLDKWAA